MSVKCHPKRTFISLLLAGVYALSLVLSIVLHQHTAGSAKEAVSLVKKQADPKLFKFGSSDSCYASHVYSAFSGSLPKESNQEIFTFGFEDFKNFKKSAFTFQRYLLFFSLRAPPMV